MRTPDRFLSDANPLLTCRPRVRSAGASFCLEGKAIPTTVIAKNNCTAGCAPEPVEKGDEPTIILIITHPEGCARVALAPSAAHALGEALIADASGGRTREVMDAGKGE